MMFIFEFLVSDVEFFFTFHYSLVDDSNKVLKKHSFYEVWNNDDYNLNPTQVNLAEIQSL